MNEKLKRLLELIKLFNSAGALEAEFEAFIGYEDPIETVDELIEAMEDEISYWEIEEESK